MGNKPQDGQNPDKVFMANFSKVMAALGVIFAICLIAAGMIASVDIRDDEGAQAQMQERLAPIGTVITDPEMLVEASAAETVSREPYSGAEVVERVCAACHTSGVLGAPKIGDNATWSQRLSEKGLETLVKHSIEGLNSMPPRGGDASLSDDEVHKAVEHLLERSDVAI